MRREPENYAEIKVMVEHTYLVPVDKNGKTLNGWTVDELVKDWFVKFPLGQGHASRDYHELGGGKRFVSAKWIKTFLGLM